MVYKVAKLYMAVKSSIKENDRSDVLCDLDVAVVRGIRRAVPQIQRI